METKELERILKVVEEKIKYNQKFHFTYARPGGETKKHILSRIEIDKSKTGKYYIMGYTERSDLYDDYSEKIVFRVDNIVDYKGRTFNKIIEKILNKLKK